MPFLSLRSWWLLVGLCLLAAPAVRAADAPTAVWIIQTREETRGQLPTIQIDLVVNGRQTVAIEPARTMGGASVTSRSQYAAGDIPARALCACSWYVVDTGAHYYVVAAGKGRLALYRRTYDENGTTRFKKIRTIQVEPR